MTRRRVLALITMLIAMLTLLGAPAAEARKRHRHYRASAQNRRCHNDKQCKGGTCNDAGQCCLNFAGEIACGTGCCNTLLGNTCCGGTACVDTTSDDANCGGCGNVCSGGKTCQSGSCGCPSFAPTECNGECSDTTFDPDNCGACGHVCDSRSCTNSTCDCPAGQTDCNGACKDLQSDRNSCGACGNVCPADQDCVAGSCQNLCPTCEVFQDGACVPKECGPCETCDPTTDQCKSSCWSGQACCSDTCVNPRVAGDGAVCCEWDGNPFACGATEQCAGAFGCCSAGTEVCVSSSGNGQCCSGGLVCQAGRCCNPDPYPQCIGTACCYNY